MTAPTATARGRHPADVALAAFVDGRLAGAERRRLVEHLASCEVCREVVAETAKTLRDPELAAVLDAAEEDDDEANQPSPAADNLLMPPPTRFRRALPLIATLAAAAGVTALLVLTPVGRGFLGLDPLGVGALTDGLESAGYTERGDHGWDVFMGGGTIEDVEPETRFQIGVRAAELDVALRHDRQAARRVLARLRELADPLVASFYYDQLDQRLADDDEEDVATLLALTAGGEASLRAEESSSLPWYELGRWAGAGSLAARSEDASWFRRRAVRREWRRLRGEGWPPAIEGPLAEIEGLLAHRIEDAEWAPLQEALAALIAAGGDHDDWPQDADGPRPSPSP